MKLNNKMIMIIIIILLIILFFVFSTTVKGKYILNSSKVIFNLDIDREPPNIYGVKNEEKYDESKTITYSDNRGIAKAEYEYSENKNWNGNTNELKSGTTFKNTGYYKVTVTDTSGNSTQITFFIGVPFITEWTVQNNTKIKLPIASNGSGYQYDFTIDWGDGTKQNLMTNKEMSHTYIKAGTYKVQILGICENWSFKEYEANYSKYLSKIVQWGEISAKHYDFKDCTNLKGNIPSPTQNSFKNIISFDSLFYNCSNLTGTIPNNVFINTKNNKNFSWSFYNCYSLIGSIPSGLFKDSIGVTDFNMTFFKCKSLTGAIPEDLFETNVSATNFQSTFHVCESLTSIPEKLFSNNKKAISFFDTFSGCNNIKGNIPKELFANCPNVTNFDYVFYKCYSLTGNIPAELFSNCRNVTSFQYTFADCINLTGNIPKELFSNCNKVTNFQWTFASCSNLTGSIPKGLFDNCNKVTNFSLTFSGCTKLTGNAPEIWNRTGVTSYDRCFWECYGLENYNDIPASWGGGKINTVNLQQQITNNNTTQNIIHNENENSITLKIENVDKKSKIE